eukprot:1158699-Pelagomonas_calceolata.AAC.6
MLISRSSRLSTQQMQSKRWQKRQRLQLQLQGPGLRCVWGEEGGRLCRRAGLMLQVTGLRCVCGGEEGGRLCRFAGADAASDRAQVCVGGEEGCRLCKCARVDAASDSMEAGGSKCCNVENSP